VIIPSCIWYYHSLSIHSVLIVLQEYPMDRDLGLGLTTVHLGMLHEVWVVVV
jgi:hypothetical protein